MKSKNIVARRLVMTIVVFVLLISQSCTKNFEETNTPWDKPPTATVGELYNGIVEKLKQTWQEQATYNTWINPATQIGAVVGNSGYTIQSASSEVWSNYYNILGNARLIEAKIAEVADPATYNNVLAMLKTIISYQTIKVSELYGSLPYTEAGYATQGTQNYSPKYDTQEEIFRKVLEDLDWALENFSDDAGQVSIGSSEMLLKNNLSMWRKFANSLRLRTAMTIASKLPDVAQIAVEKSLASPVLEEQEFVGLDPEAITGLAFDGRTWSFESGVFIRMGSTAWDQMSANDNEDGSGIFDPRCQIFFEVNGQNKWKPYPQNSSVTDGGRPYHANRATDWDDPEAQRNALKYSPYNYYIGRDQEYPELFITSAEVSLLKAEAYARGVGVSQNLTQAKTFYENGIRSSIAFWYNVAIRSSIWLHDKPSAQPSEAQIMRMLNHPKIMLNTASSQTALAQIYTQQWLALFRQPWESWTLQRRTGNQTPLESENAQAYENSIIGTIKRFTYPVSEQNYNFSNWQAATGGDDLQTTSIWLMPQEN